ncbi:MAG: dihydrodipicolinate synthase family protein [Clostridia bacterium]|nr:dihydrodipicolinate synthase family protein [Clostridia bacterium]
MNLLNAKGSSAIPLVPFLENGDIDFDTFEKEIDWICSSKVGSICGPVNVSEFMVLTQEERNRFVKTMVDVTAGRTCIIANVAATNIKDAVKYTEFAEKSGADAVIAMPPYVGELNFGGIKEYFGAIAHATSLPVMIQNMDLPNGKLSVEDINMLCEMAPNISWVKQEVSPPPVGVALLNENRSSAVEGIMTGFSGLYSLSDYENGATATIHACEYCDIIQKIWNLMDEGKMDEARKIHAILAPALMLEGIYTWQYTKIIMEKRGIFKNHITRNKKDVITPSAMQEFDNIWRSLESLI